VIGSQFECVFGAEMCGSVFSAVSNEIGDELCCIEVNEGCFK
jgi:hypothetical protein